MLVEPQTSRRRSWRLGTAPWKKGKLIRIDGSDLTEWLRRRPRDVRQNKTGQPVRLELTDLILQGLIASNRCGGHSSYRWLLFACDAYLARNLIAMVRLAPAAWKYPSRIAPRTSQRLYDMTSRAVAAIACKVDLGTSAL